MKILKNEIYKNLIEDSKCLHKFWKKEKDKELSELEKLPDVPRRFYCSCCDGKGYNEKKFKKFKEVFSYPDGSRGIRERVVCVECLEGIKRDYYEDDDD